MLKSREANCDWDARCVFYLKAGCAVESVEGVSEVRGTSLENSDGGRVAWPLAQIACLSCCSVRIERFSGGSDVGTRLLSTPSRLFRHTGQVSCCGSRRERE